MLLSDHRTKAIKIGTFLAIDVLAVVFLFAKPTAPPIPTPLPPLVEPGGAAYFAFMGMTALIWGSAIWSAWKLKSVQLETDRLIIGGLRQQVTVPLHQVAAVHQPWWTGRLARIELDGETAFGSSVWFLTTRPDSGLLGPSRGVLELRARVAGAKGDRSAPPLPPASTDYTADWARLRRWRRIQWLGIPAFIVGVPIVLSLTDGSLLSLVYVLPVMFGFMLAGIKTSTWPCPQCGQRFFTGSWGIQVPALFVRECGHCGLPKGQTTPSSPVTSRS